MLSLQANEKLLCLQEALLSGIRVKRKVNWSLFFSLIFFSYYYNL